MKSQFPHLCKQQSNEFLYWTIIYKKKKDHQLEEYKDTETCITLNMCTYLTRINFLIVEWLKLSKWHSCFWKVWICFYLQFQMVTTQSWFNEYSELELLELMVIFSPKPFFFFFLPKYVAVGQESGWTPCF